MNVNSSEYNVVYITDAAYVLPTKVSILSAIRNASDEKIHIWIVGVDISESDKKEIERISNDNTDITVVEMTIMDRFATANSHEYVSKSDLYKFYLAEIFDKIGRILYVDADTILFPGWLSVFDYDISDYYMGAVRDMIAELNDERIWRLGHSHYYNAGMMLLNLEKIRTDGCVEKMEEYRLNNEDYYMDQDTINKILGESTYELPVGYNLLTEYKKMYSIEEAESFYKETNGSSLREMWKRPFVLHMAGGDKPWNDPSSELWDIWKEYLDPEYITVAEVTRLTKSFIVKYNDTIKQQRDIIRQLQDNLRFQQDQLAERDRVTQNLINELRRQNCYIEKKVNRKKEAEQAGYFYSLEEEILFSNKWMSESYIISGMYENENWGRWTKGTECKMQFYLVKVKHDLNLQMEYVVYGEKQSVDIFINDTKMDSFAEAGGRHSRTIRIPRKLVRDGSVRLRLVLSDAIKPKDYEGTADERTIALGMIKLVISESKSFSLGIR